VFAVVWALFGLYWYRTRPGNVKVYDFRKYIKYFIWLVVGFSLSVVSAQIFWNQNLLIGIMVNRVLIWYLYLPLLLYIQPSEKDIIKAIVYYTIGYFIIWTIQALTPYPIITDLRDVIELGRGSFEHSELDFGHLLNGYSLILFLLYYRTQKLTENFSFKTTIQVFGLLGLLFLLQNRGVLFFAVIVFSLALFKIHSRYRIILIPFLAALLVGAYDFSASHWNTLFQETIEQLSDPYYPRWESLSFFVFDYAPHWICNLVGNGFLSANVPAGKFIQDMMDQGYYQYDNGILGFWSQYGIIPLIVLYTVIFTLLFQKKYPFYTKAIAAHILFIPIAWNFQNADIFIFIFLIYLYAYYRELNKVAIGELYNSHRELPSMYLLKSPEN
jgi:hypothetical protein